MVMVCPDAACAASSDKRLGREFVLESLKEVKAILVGQQTSEFRNGIVLKGQGDRREIQVDKEKGIHGETLAGAQAARAL